MNSVAWLRTEKRLAAAAGHADPPTGTHVFFSPSHPTQRGALGRRRGGLADTGGIEQAKQAVALRTRLRMTLRRPGAIGGCGARTQEACVAGGYGRDRGRRTAPASAAGRLKASF